MTDRQGRSAVYSSGRHIPYGQKSQQSETFLLSSDTASESAAVWTQEEERRTGLRKLPSQAVHALLPAVPGISGTLGKNLDHGFQLHTGRRAELRGFLLLCGFAGHGWLEDVFT